MSGHSKWSQIKRKKGVKDQEKGKVFSKMSKLILLAVQEGGGLTDPERNLRLRAAIDQAKAANVPKENINRAIERASGPDKQQLHEMIYEAFGPGGIALLIQATTDNPNRTSSETRSVIEKHGGKLGSQGSVNYLFRKCASAIIDKAQKKEEEIFALADQLGAFDIEEDENSFTIYFPFENIGKADVPSELDFKPVSSVKIEDRATAKKILTLMDRLEALDDIQKVFANFDIPEEFLTI